MRRYDVEKGSTNDGTGDEYNRGSFNAVVPLQDLIESYWPQFKTAVSGANLGGVMCSCEHDTPLSTAVLHLIVCACVCVCVCVCVYATSVDEFGPTAPPPPPLPPRARTHLVQSSYLQFFSLSIHHHAIIQDNAVNGVPSCANDVFNNQILRNFFNFSGMIVSDCGAVSGITGSHNYTHTPDDTVRTALRGGTDLNCGTYVHIPPLLDCQIVRFQQSHLQSKHDCHHLYLMHIAPLT